MIIFINGASSSGKTSLARALQDTWKAPLIYWSLDSVISQLPFLYTGADSTSLEGFPIQRADNGEHRVAVGSLGQKLNQLSAEYLKSLADENLDVVVDYVLLDSEMYEHFRLALKDSPLLFVGLYCDPDELAARNARRENRAAGLSVAQQEQVHFCASDYDLTLNSSHASPAAMAAAIMAHSESRTPTGFGVRSRES